VKIPQIHDLVLYSLVKMVSSDAVHAGGVSCSRWSLSFRRNCAMSKSNESLNQVDAKTVTTSVTCAGGCPHGFSGVLRAIVYAPLVLVVGGFAAVAAFPNLAEYATPLIGESTSTPVYPFNGTGMSSGGGSCCGRARAATSSCSLSAMPARSCRYGGLSCCSQSDEISVLDNTSVDAEAPINAEFTSSESDGDDLALLTPADAISAANVTDVAETETSSN
jgi:hypothetical protein